MGKRQVGAGGAGWMMGPVLGLALAMGCDSGESTPVGSAGSGGASSSTSGTGSGGQAGGSAGKAGNAGGGGGGGASGAGGPSSGGVAGSAGTSAGQAGTSGGADAGGAGGVSGEGGASAGGEDGVGGDAGGAGGGAGAGGGGGVAGAGGTGGVNLGGNAGSGGSVGCQTAQFSFVPLESTVMLLVDGSGTMFAGTGPTVWDRVRSALLPSIDAADAQQNIGFLAMSAEQNACPAFQEVAPAKNNYTAIASKYAAIAKPTKGESPFPLALDRAAQLLDGKAGDKHVIFVIDGEPDYCNDGQPDCPIDSTVWRLQKLRAAGVTTHVAALPFPPILPDVSASRQSYANAGAGSPVGIFGGVTESYGYYTCYSNANWAADHTAAGKGAEALIATYSATPGTAPFSALDPNDANALQASFQQLFAETRSCSFELTGGLKIALDEASTGAVSLDGQAVAFDAANGWHLQSQTVLQLSGAACTKLHASVTAKLDVQFPCSAITN